MRIDKLTVKDKRRLLERIRQYKESPPMPDVERAYKKKKGSTDLELYLEVCPPQSYGARVEKLYCKENGFEKVPSKLDKGDFNTPEGKYGEYKFSYAKSGKSYRYNFVQIRPWQKIDGYVLETYSDLYGITTFNLSKKSIDTLIEKFGGLAHGTKETNTNVKKEYALRGKIGDEMWDEMSQLNESNLF